MAVDFNSTSVEPCSRDQNVVFDAEAVALLGRFSDEIAAYRTRRRWVEVLGSYFLLERDRDYELKVSFSEEHGYFVLGCTFVSACGRYAFWRLINHQAPEAEQKLSPSGKAKSLTPKKGSRPSGAVASEMPWIITGLGQKSRRPRLLGALLDRLNKALL